MRFMRQEEAVKAMNLFEGAQEHNRVSKRSLKNWVVTILQLLLSSMHLSGKIKQNLWCLLKISNRCRLNAVGKRIQRAQSSCPDAQRHQDRSEQAAPDGQRCGRADRVCALASHPGDRDVQVLRLAQLAASRGGVHVWEHSQDHLRGDRVPVRDASFRCRRPMRS